MKITIELDTNMDSMDKITAVLGSFKAGDDNKVVVLEPYKPPTIGGRVPPFSVTPSRRPIIDKKDLNELFLKVKEGVKEADRQKGSKRPRNYSSQLKRDVINYVKSYKNLYPEATMEKIGKIINVSYTTFYDWLKGQKLGSAGGHRFKTGRSMGWINERNEKIVNYLNKNPYECWEDVGKKFNLSSTAIYSIAKVSRKVRIMNRAWSPVITKETALRSKPEPVIIEESMEEPKKTMGQVILKFEKSRVDADKTIAGINECIGKGSLSYRQDADKFGFDRRMLPTTDWYDFMTDVAKTVNRLMGIDVILDPTLSGITFKN
jgi:hypothetical protein